MQALLRKRLLAAVTLMFNPSPSVRRNMVKASKRRWKAERAELKDAVKHETGIRALRRQPVFTTPNVFPPKGLLQDAISAEADTADTDERRSLIEPSSAIAAFA